MLPMYPISRLVLLFAFVSVALANIGCHENGYRTEVYPGTEGRYTMKRVKVDEPPPPAPAAPLPPPPPKDPDLAKLEDSWANLSPADRKAVSDLAARLAAH